MNSLTKTAKQRCEISKRNLEKSEQGTTKIIYVFFLVVTVAGTIMGAL